MLKYVMMLTLIASNLFSLPAFNSVEWIESAQLKNIITDLKSIIELNNTQTAAAVQQCDMAQQTIEAINREANEAQRTAQESVMSLAQQLSETKQQVDTIKNELMTANQTVEQLQNQEKNHEQRAADQIVQLEKTIQEAQKLYSETVKQHQEFCLIQDHTHKELASLLDAKDGEVQDLYTQVQQQRKNSQKQQAFINKLQHHLSTLKSRPYSSRTDAIEVGKSAPITEKRKTKAVRPKSNS